MSTTYDLQEVALDITEDGYTAYADLSVLEGDTVTTMTVENSDTSVTLQLDLNDLDDLIAALQRARDAASANA